MRSRLLSLSILASLAQPVPTGRTGGHVRGPLGRMHHRPVRNAEGDTGAVSGTGEKGTTGSADGAPGGAKDEPLIPQSKVNEIAAKERRSAEAKALAAQKERDELAAKVAEFEQKQREAEEAKLSAAQRQELERKRERETWETKLKDAETRAARERTLRHDTLKQREASRLAASVAQQLYKPESLKHVERSIAERLVIEEREGVEHVVLQMGAPGDNEPLETGWPKLRDVEIAPAFFRVQEGTGARHGQGATAGGRQNWQGLSPNDKIIAGLSGGTKK